MSLFRKQAATAVPATTPDERGPALLPAPAPTTNQGLFNGPVVDFQAMYQASKLSSEELDRVSRAEELLRSIPSAVPLARGVVDATFKAFGVDRSKILSAAERQRETLEAFVRYSHDQTQNVIDANAKRIAELEAEIDRCRKVSAQASSEGEERARSVNEVMLKVERVLEFFGDEQHANAADDLDEDTTINGKPDDSPAPSPKGARPGSKTSPGASVR